MTVPGRQHPSDGAPRGTTMRVGTLPTQVDATTCGIAALAVVAGRAGAAPGYLGASRRRQEAAQRRLHALAARTGIPWPQSLGTSPWALARLAGRATGEPWCVLPWSRGARLALIRANAQGRDTFVYVGGGPHALGSALVDSLGPAAPLARRLADLVPRHVVAVLAEAGAAVGREDDEGARAQWLEVFEPSSGSVTRLPAETLEGPWPLPGAPFGNWPRPLIALVPRASSIGTSR